MDDRIALQQGDASQAAKPFPGRFFDLTLGHNILEFVDAPAEWEDWNEHLTCLEFAYFSRVPISLHVTSGN